MTGDTISEGVEEWYAIQSKPRQEERAEGDLLAWGVETFLPRIRRRSLRRWAGAVGGSQPLFPGYLFARFNGPRMAHKIRYTRGVARIVGTALGPTPVDGSIIALIRSQIADQGLVELSFNTGDRVRIGGGPLRDFVGVFTATVTATGRVRALLTAVNGRYKVVVNQDLLERLQ
jgi:transcriptional antiterminator RfaH